tara:strand:- start:7 stop:492 length:486 start_codon:yes stop_codon:yes gene_type:complete
MKNLLERKNVVIVKKYLQKIYPKIKLIELNRSARTAQEAANSLQKKVGAIVKSILFKTEENEFYLCLVSGDKYISEKKLAIITQKTIMKANANIVKQQTGFSIGCVPPVAHLYPPTRVFIDINLKRFEMVYAAAGHTHIVFGITFSNLCFITKGEIQKIVE